MLQGIITLLCFAAFVGIVIWAYGSGRKARFDEASRLPLQDDTPPRHSATRREP